MQNGEALVMCPPQNLPAEVHDIFLKVQRLHQQEFDQAGTNYLADLFNVTRAIGFTNYLGLVGSQPQPRGVFSAGCHLGRPACDLPSPLDLKVAFKLQATEAEQRLFLGQDYEALSGPCALVVPWGLGLQMGPFSLALNIAHEVGCLKLAVYGALNGLREEDLPRPAQTFYSQAYLYNFIHYLLKVMAPLPRTPEWEAEQRYVIPCLRSAYDYGLGEYNDKLRPAERKVFRIIGSPDAARRFGLPLSIDLVNPRLG